MRKLSVGIAVAQGLVLVVYAASLLVAASKVETTLGSPIIESIIYLIFAALILFVARGLDKEQSWSRTPFLLTQLFAIIIAYTLFVGDDDSYKIAGVILGIVAFVGIVALVKTPIEN